MACTPGGYHSFEHRWALAETFALHQAIGRTRVAARSRGLASMLEEGLAGISKVRLRTPRSPELSAALVCCEMTCYSARDAVAALQPTGVLASATPYMPSYLRFGTSVLTNESDVDRALTAVRAL